MISASIGFVPLSFAASGQWIKYGNSVLSPTPNTWDFDSVTGPKVLYSGGVFRMWYLGSHTGATAIGYANSTDGVTWKKYPSPVLSTGPSGSWDSSGIGLGSVLWNGSLFLMWYSGSSPVDFPNGAFGLATSSDGLSWVKFTGNPVMTPSDIDQRYMASPFVIRKSLTYNMWYSGRSSSDLPSSQVTRILYAYSFDGVTWNKWPQTVLNPSTDPSAWDSDSVYASSVVFDGTTYGMWYSGLGQSLVNPQIGYATSPDGTSWTKSFQNPILGAGSAGSWDSAGVEQPSATFAKGFMLYYDGFGRTTGTGIGLAYPPQEFKIPEFPNSTLVVLFGVLASSMTLLALNRISRRRFASTDANFVIQ
jgi:predicted GH43/DUF377 family glycosyl hydrolase